MSKIWQLKSLIRKNLIVMKRNIISTILEFIFPIVMIFLLYMMKKTLGVSIYNEPSDDEDFFQTNSTALVDPSNYTADGHWNGLTILRPL
jgi:hypothetical protein